MLKKKPEWKVKHYVDRMRSARPGGRADTQTHPQFVLLLFSLDKADPTKVHPG